MQDESPPRTALLYTPTPLPLSGHEVYRAATDEKAPPIVTRALFPVWDITRLGLLL
jgi:hypothetical protein